MEAREICGHLVKVCIDSANRYRHAARDVSREDLQAFFEHQAAELHQSADELDRLRVELGGESAPESGSLRGAAERLALDLSVIMSMGDSGVIEWCREELGQVLAAYRSALEQTELPKLQVVLRRQVGALEATAAELDRLLQAYGGPRS